MNQRTDAPEDRSNGNLVSMAHKAAMYGAWQNETLARKTLYWLLADRIDRQEGDLATIQANIHLGSIPAPVSETGDRNAVLEEAKMVCIGILGQQHTGCSQATVAQACVDAIDSLKTSAATAAQDAASQAAMHQVLPLPPQPDAITTTTPVETDHKGRPITYWGGLDKPAGAAPSSIEAPGCAHCMGCLDPKCPAKELFKVRGLLGAANNALAHQATLLSEKDRELTATRSATGDSKLLDWLRDTIKACPHAVITWNDDADLEDEHGVVPIGFSLRIDGCDPISIAANDFRELLTNGVNWRAADVPTDGSAKEKT